MLAMQRLKNFAIGLHACKAMSGHLADKGAIMRILWHDMVRAA